MQLSFQSSVITQLGTLSMRLSTAPIQMQLQFLARSPKMLIEKRGKAQFLESKLQQCWTKQIARRASTLKKPKAHRPENLYMTRPIVNRNSLVTQKTRFLLQGQRRLKAKTEPSYFQISYHNLSKINYSFAINPNQYQHYKFPKVKRESHAKNQSTKTIKLSNFHLINHTISTKFIKVKVSLYIFQFRILKKSKINNYGKYRIRLLSIFIKLLITNKFDTFIFVIFKIYCC